MLFAYVPQEGCLTQLHIRYFSHEFDVYCQPDFFSKLTLILSVYMSKGLDPGPCFLVICHLNKKCHKHVTNAPKGIGLAQDTFEER